jgi:hypothetical protein
MPHKKNLTTTSLSVSVQLIERRIYLIRGQKVMVDADLRSSTGVTTKRLNQQVTRNSRHAVDCAELLNSEQAIEVNIAIMRAFVSTAPDAGNERRTQS